MLNMRKTFVFKNEASESNYNIQKSLFIKRNTKDEQNNFSEKFEIPGYRSRMLYHDLKSDSNASSLCIGYQFFVIFHLLLLGPCYRLWFKSWCGLREIIFVRELELYAEVKSDF